MSCRHLPFIMKSFFAVSLCVISLSCDRQPVQTATAIVPAAANPAKPSSIRAKEISFGRRQIDQMLADRPDMAGILSDDDAVLLWVIDGLDGKRIGQRVYWNNRSPESGASAEHWRGSIAFPPCICLMDSVDSPKDKWVLVVYELFNLENDPSFDTLDKEAYAGAIHGDAYATECARLEYNAFVKAREFFEKNPIPRAPSGNDRYYDQVLETPQTFEEYMASSTDIEGMFQHPGEYYKTYYDKRIAPYVVPERKYKRRK